MKQSIHMKSTLDRLEVVPVSNHVVALIGPVFVSWKATAFHNAVKMFIECIYLSQVGYRFSSKSLND